MLIPFSELIKKYNIKPTGVLHIGGSHAEELEAYVSNGIEQMIWIEAIPEVFEKMEKRLENYHMAIAINACIADTDGKEVEFKITTNEGQSSSILNLKHHLIAHPNVQVCKTIKCITQTMDSIIDQRGFDITYYDFLNIDLQGAELMALKGMKNNLHKIKYAYIEVNKKELYEGCPMIEEIDAFLSQYGFSRAETKWAGDTGWGDAFYIKENTKDQ